MGPVQQTTQVVAKHSTEIKKAADSALALGAMSVPAWLDGVSTWIGFAAAVLGLALLGIRVYLGVQEILEKRRGRKKG